MVLLRRQNNPKSRGLSVRRILGCSTTPCRRESPAVPARARGTLEARDGAGAPSQRARPPRAPAHSRLTRARARHRAPMGVVVLPDEETKLGKPSTPVRRIARPRKNRPTARTASARSSAGARPPRRDARGPPRARRRCRPDPDADHPVPTKKRRNRKPFRIEIGPPKEGEERDEVNKPNGRYNKNGVCFHKASGKWRAIVYVGKRQVSRWGTSPPRMTRTGIEASSSACRRVSPALRAMQQPKQSEHAGVNWDKHTKKWLASGSIAEHERRQGEGAKVWARHRGTPAVRAIEA